MRTTQYKARESLHLSPHILRNVNPTTVKHPSYQDAQFRFSSEAKPEHLWTCKLQTFIEDATTMPRMESADKLKSEEGLRAGTRASCAMPRCIYIAPLSSVGLRPHLLARQHQPRTLSYLTIICSSSDSSPPSAPVSGGTEHGETSQKYLLMIFSYLSQIFVT